MKLKTLITIVEVLEREEARAVSAAIEAMGKRNRFERDNGIELWTDIEELPEEIREEYLKLKNEESTLGGKCDAIREAIMYLNDHDWH